MKASEIASKLNIHPTTITDIVKRKKLEIRNKESYHNRLYNINDIVKWLMNCPVRNQYTAKWVDVALTKTYDKYWKLDWDEFIVGCDTHVPHYNEKIINRLLEVRNKYKIKNFIHAGDFFDQNTFSQFVVEPEDIVPWEVEVKEAKKLVDTFTNEFKDVRFFMGSHDVRFWLMLLRQGKAIDYNMPFKMLENEKIKTSKYRYCEIGKEWRINHPKNVVKVGGFPSIRMSAKFQRSIIFGHGHWAGLTKDPSGHHYLIAPGCLCDPLRIAYKNMWDTSHDNWSPGFVLIVEKTKPILFLEDSPWEIYLGNRK